MSQQLITKYCSGSSNCGDSPAGNLPPNYRIPKKRTTAKAPVKPAEAKSPTLRNWLKKPAKPNLEMGSPKKYQNKKSTKLNRNDSFDEECRRNDENMKRLMKTVRQNQQHKQCMDEIRELDKLYERTGISNVPFRNIEESAAEKPLDCYDMTDDEIAEALHKNLDYLRDIRDGKVPNRRHDMYKSKRCDVRNSLCYNVSMIAFTREHKRYLANKLLKYFEDDGGSYYFKVLLPELCLKIFMDKYNMTYDEAYKYLDEAPVVDSD